MENDKLTLMLVHAHPDDESIGTGGILAKYAAEGIHTVLVTCTRGELGDIQDPENFVPPKPDMSMKEIRKIELDDALKILNVGEFYCLEYRDSGMKGTPGNEDPRSFAQADLEDASNRLVYIIRETRPQVIVTYDETGIYWHPDHVKAHQITQKAFFDAGDATVRTGNGQSAWQPSKLYHIAIPMPRIRRYEKMAAEEGETVERPPSSIVGTPDEKITTRIDITDYLEDKFQAIFSHKSQIGASHRFRNLTEAQKSQMFGFEHFVCAYGCPKRNENKKESDLFEGLRE